MNTQLDEARRKGATGSRQEEGFTQQDLFAEELRRRFPADEITVTPRGVCRGRRHPERYGSAVTTAACSSGSASAPRDWSGAWIGKLADDVDQGRSQPGRDRLRRRLPSRVWTAPA